VVGSLSPEGKDWSIITLFSDSRLREAYQLRRGCTTGVYVALSFAGLEVPEGEVEELPDETWLVMADKPVVFAVGDEGAVVELSLTPCGVERVGELKRAAALAAIAMAKWPPPPAKRPEAIVRELIVGKF